MTTTDCPAPAVAPEQRPAPEPSPPIVLTTPEAVAMSAALGHWLLRRGRRRKQPVLVPLPPAGTAAPAAVHRISAGPPNGRQAP